MAEIFMLGTYYGWMASNDVSIPNFVNHYVIDCINL